MKQAVEAKEETPTCTVCHKELGFNDWGPCLAQPGNCTVPAITFYTPAARSIQDLRDRRKYSPVIILRAGGESWQNGSLIQGAPALVVHFHDSKYTTSNPEEIYFLQRDPEFRSGPEGENMWKEVCLTSEQKATAAKSELAALEAKIRSMREGTSLLDATKASVR